MPDKDPNELVRIKHPQIEGLGGPVPRYALDDLWSKKGWSEATAADLEKAATQAEATALGIDTSATAGKEKK